MSQRHGTAKEPKSGLEKHREIILEALRDYRRWGWDADKTKQIDAAIKFIEAGKTKNFFNQEPETMPKRLSGKRMF